MTAEEWETEFQKYKASPEFRLAHSHMGVEDFKFIYYMEWGHRMWGRCGVWAASLPTVQPRVVQLVQLISRGTEAVQHRLLMLSPKP